MHQAFALITGFHQFAAFFIFGGMGLRILDHFFNIAIGQTAGCLNTDLLFLAGSLVLGRDADDTIGVDIENHLHLRHAARRRR